MGWKQVGGKKDHYFNTYILSDDVTVLPAYTLYKAVIAPSFAPVRCS